MRRALLSRFSIIFLVGGCGVASDLGAEDSTTIEEAATSATTTYKVLANNDLGMHCVDKDFSVFSILPPYNVVSAQVVKNNASGNPTRLDATTVKLTYSAVADATGSINTKSVGKTNFWQYGSRLFGLSLATGQGLKGLYMPGDAPSSAPAVLTWSSTMSLFRAEGIPATPIDDKGTKNYYPLMRVAAFDKSTNKLLASVATVVPVSDETTCANCHATGKAAAKETGVAWASDADVEIQARKNILILHDMDQGTKLVASQPVLCAGCHYSPALDLAGAGQSAQQKGKPLMSAVMHAFHSDKMLKANGQALNDAPVARGGTPPAPTDQSCYQCHPGANTKCLRGTMTDKVDCQNCHGPMKAVGGASPLAAGGSIDGTNEGKARRPWTDVPRCQSCHTGDAQTHLTGLAPMDADGLRFLTAFKSGDSSASPILATNKRFAEETNKPYKLSKGHGGIACEGCHGSTHAWWANASAGANDNVEATQLQGHSGFVGECSTCHNGSLPNTVNGPHGMHPVNSSKWVSGHHSFAGKSGANCKTCHGLDLKGSALSEAFADRSFKIEGGTKTVKKGTAIGCYTCHNGPSGD